MDGVTIGPVVVCIRGPSRSGKTTMVTRLVPLLAAAGVRVAYVKRTHHLLDLPEKSSGRVWAAEPAAMVIRAPDRVQVTLPAGDASAREVLRHVPREADVVLLETHQPEPYPTVLAAAFEPCPGERVIGRWELGSVEADADAAAAAIRALLPGDLVLDRALRAARELHGGEACAGIILGTRLALYAGELLGVELPDRAKRLVVRVEMERCAADAIAAVTGCRPGRRTLRFVDYGKLAATFWDLREGRAVRVAARGNLRELVGEDGRNRHAAQAAAYLAWPAERLFTVTPVEEELGALERPGRPLRRVRCTACGEEVSDGREVATEDGPRCRPCATGR